MDVIVMPGRTQTPDTRQAVQRPLPQRHSLSTNEAHALLMRLCQAQITGAQAMQRLIHEIEDPSPDA